MNLCITGGPHWLPKSQQHKMPLLLHGRRRQQAPSRTPPEALLHWSTLSTTPEYSCSSPPAPPWSTWPQASQVPLHTVACLDDERKIPGNIPAYILRQSCRPQPWTFQKVKLSCRRTTFPPIRALSRMQRTLQGHWSTSQPITDVHATSSICPQNQISCTVVHFSMCSQCVPKIRSAVLWFTSQWLQTLIQYSITPYRTTNLWQYESNLS